jgi:uncharacterized protein YabN with tetrapyrrole methylase and pyrophosphatase domain
MPLALAVVGTGIQFSSHMTPQARAQIDRAERVFYHVNDPVTHADIAERRPDAESLHDLYDPSVDRQITYARMVERILTDVRAGYRVCVALYGHPGVFAYPAHEAIKIARGEGYAAAMFPAVSAEDCLFADLGVDPAEHGCVSVEATDFLVHGRRIDPTMSLVVWQIGAIGELRAPVAVNVRGLRVLTAALLRDYPPHHEVIVYEAAQYVIVPPAIERVRLRDLASASISHRSTLYVPPCMQHRVDEKMLALLGLVAT